MEKKKNATTVALKKLCKTFPRINVRGHREYGAPNWSDPYVFQVEGHTEGKMQTRASVELSGLVHGGCTDSVEMVTPSSPEFGGPYEKYNEGFRPQEGFWFLFGHDEVLRSVVAMLPDDADVTLEVYLDAGTHQNLVKHRMHHDILYLMARWTRGTKRYERRFMLDSTVSYHNTNRWGGPNTLARR